MAPPRHDRMRTGLLLLTQLVIGAVPWHAHADHSADVAHVEPAHGGHELVLIQTDQRQRSDVQDAFLPAGDEVAVPVFGETTESGGRAEPAAPPSRPPPAQPPPRGPPTLL